MKVPVAFVLCLLLSSCGGPAIPKDVLPKDKMTAVLWDVMLADALTTHRYPADSLKRFDTGVILYQQIARAHGTTQAQLKRSLQFYESRPDLLQVILDSLQKRATLPLEALKKDTLQGDTLQKTIKSFKRPANPLRGLAPGSVPVSPEAR